jgi:acetolactate synthase-1/2/3 large subunit
MTGGQAVVETLDAWGVEVVFGIPGIHTLAIYDALYQHPRIRHVTARHEQGAGFMADGYARASGRIGVVLTTTGPAAMNALTPIGEAYAESSPVLLICSGPTDETHGADSGVLHDMRDQFGTLLSVTGRGNRVSQVSEIPDALTDGFEMMTYGRPRPFVLEVPLDVVAQEADLNIVEPAHRPTQMPDEAAIQAAVEMIGTAKRPMLIVGGGAQGASAQVIALAEKIGAWVCVTSNGPGIIPADHALYLGDVSAARQQLMQADVVLAVGTRLGHRVQQGWEGKPQKLIHLDIDKEVIGRTFDPDVSLVGDAGAGLGALCDRVGNNPSLWEAKPAGSENVAVDGHFGELLAVMRNVLDRDAVLVNDMTMISYQARRQFPVYAARSFLSPTVYGTLGFSMPAAIGAKIACPDRQVVSLCGDGGFLFTATELSTARQQNVALPIVVCNDHTYTAIKRAQDRESGGRYIGVDLANPDFVMFVKSFGLEATRVTDCEAFEKALKAGLGAAGPTVIEVFLPDFS